MIDFIKEGIVPRGKYKGLKFYEYGFPVSAHEQINKQHQANVSVWKQKVADTPVMQIRLPYPSVISPKVSYSEQIQCVDKHLDKFVEVFKKNNGNIQVVVNEIGKVAEDSEPIKLVNEVKDSVETKVTSESTEQKELPPLFTCPKCAKSFDKKQKLAVHYRFHKKESAKEEELKVIVHEV